MADRTYLQHSQPSTFGHYLLSFVYSVQREIDRLLADLDWVNGSPGGAGCVNGGRLLEPAHGEDLDRYAEQLLGPLLAYDRDHDAAMVETLEAYLRCDGHVGRAAEALRVHPTTMSYRLGRIEALTGIVVTRQEDRFNAQLALKILAIRAAGDG